MLNSERFLKVNKLLTAVSNGVDIDGDVPEMNVPISITLIEHDYYSHGCTDMAGFRVSKDLKTAKCTDRDDCHSCWQVGHDQDHKFWPVVGQVYPLYDILKSRGIDVRMYGRYVWGEEYDKAKTV